MGTPTRKSATVVAQIDAVRNLVARVRGRLLNPAAGMIEEALPDLEQAILLLWQGEGLVRPGGESGDWESARQLKNELMQVKALARQAQEFYSLRIRLLAQNDSPIDYTCNGIAPPQASLQTRPLEKGLLVHG